MGLDIRRQVAEQAGTPHEISNYIQCLLSCDPPDVRDPAMALRVGLLVVQGGNPRNPELLDNVAMAYFANGETSHAVETEKQALTLLPADQAQSSSVSLRRANRTESCQISESAHHKNSACDEASRTLM